MNESYVNYLRNNQKSENTIRVYQIHIKQMLEVVNKPENEITRLDLEDWRSTIAHLSSSSVKGKVEAVKSYFKFLKRMGLIENNPTDDMETPKVVNKQKEYLSEEMVDSMIAIANVRQKAMLMFLKVNGSRVSEMTNITIDQYNTMKQTDGVINIMAKGRVYRDIIFTDGMIEAIDNYLATRDDDCPYLFASEWGNHINSNNLNQTWKRLAYKAGIPFWQNIGSHYFRMSCATSLLEKGMPIEEVRDHLGHSSIAVTNTYAKSCPANIRKKIASYFD